ncbi:unnamed protein product (macronuclear) [Paramecium tetraurelia]|uniref:Protein kinase domain-containing protein n=1 Tax=Paramecium tetraurelia TaxID=5888 RepID=A0CM75_PARTE|nr:uncharacterized protein GSPATT00008371001 [Paramecium tetraurelia]CAK71892.1 unnamed protein product [Paramecium tetraurelia]|eukprot:XP_001439289.1 hypothetical protein (macronuclear) [Paramecium tetraurelia strain d4-2]
MQSNYIIKLDRLQTNNQEGRRHLFRSYKGLVYKNKPISCYQMHETILNYYQFCCKIMIIQLNQQKCSMMNLLGDWLQYSNQWSKTFTNIQRVENYMYQLLKAIDFMHTNNIFHRDIKPQDYSQISSENILLLGDHLKLADLGSCKGIYSKHPYTEYISTRWYRSPECLMTDGYYDCKMDIWGAGCVLFEITALFPLFPGSNELDQVHRIHNILGTPNPKVLDRFRKHASHMEINFPSKVGTGLENLIPHAPKDVVDLIKQMLIYDPDERINAKQALRHPYFKELRDLEQQKLLETSLQSIKLLKKADDSLIEEDQNTSHVMQKKTLLNQTNKILQNSFKTRNQQFLDSVKLPTLTKKQADLKKAYGPVHFQNKETKKKSVQYEYVLYGKKANLGNFLNTIRQK